MGDRTNCILTISGSLAAWDVDRLAQALEKARTYTKPAAQRLLDEENEFEFEEVNYAELDPDLSDALDALGLSYEWAWSPGDTYGEGVQAHSAEPIEGLDENDRFCDLHRTRGTILLTLDEASDPAALKRIQTWDAWLRKPKTLTIYRSQHERLANASKRAHRDDAG